MKNSNNNVIESYEVTYCSKVNVKNETDLDLVTWELKTLDGETVYSTGSNSTIIDLSQKSIYYVDAGTKLELKASAPLVSDAISYVFIEYHPNSKYTSIFKLNGNEREGINIDYKGVET